MNTNKMINRIKKINYSKICRQIKSRKTNSNNKIRRIKKLINRK